MIENITVDKLLREKANTEDAICEMIGHELMEFYKRTGVRCNHISIDLITLGSMGKPNDYHVQSAKMSLDLNV